MSQKKYVSPSGLSTFLSRLRSIFAPIDHEHTIDSTLSDTSTNPVQNKVINDEFSAVEDAMGILGDVIDTKSQVNIVEAGTSAHVPTLNIYKISQEEYDQAFENGTLDGDAIYLTPDEEPDLSIYATNEALNGKSDKNHTHTTSQVTDLTATLDEIKASKANTSHASSDTTYGAGSASNYGHVKLSDAVDSESKAASGIAASPYAVKSVKSLVDSITSTANSHINSKSNPHGVTASQIGVYTKSEIDSKVSTLNTSISGKASKATTLSGYGITDAYTKAEIDSAIDAIDLLGSGTSIPTGSDLDTYTTVGKYFMGSESGAQSLLNCPTTTNFCMYVIVRTSGSSKTQIVVCLNGKTYVRSCNSSGVWRDWQAYATEANLSSLQETIEASLSKKADSSHTHDDRYYTESEIDTKLSSKANTSHGNHVPTTQTANNKVFLRNDNTWATITPENIGAAANSHGTHVSYGTSATAVGATASAGSATTVSRSDHTHSLSKSAVTTALGYTPPTSDTNTTYTFSTGDSNGQIKVTPSGGSAQNVSVKGLGTAAYTASTAYAASSHNHSASNITSGKLAVARGGTGVTSNPSMLINLESTSAASVFAASPRPGVTGVLPIENGGTGCNSYGDALAALGLSAITATGSTTDVSMPAGTITKIPLTTKVGYTDKNGFFSLNSTNSSGSIEIQGQGLYLICGSVYIKNTAKSGTTVAQAACYIKKQYGDTETELVSASVDINPSTSRDVCVSTGMKVVALEDNAILSLHARTNNGVAAVAKANNGGTYLTVVRLCFTVS